MAFDAIVWWSGVELCRQVQAEFHHVSDDQLTPEGNWFFPPPGPARIPQNRGGGEQQQKDRLEEQRLHRDCDKRNRDYQ